MNSTYIELLVIGVGLYAAVKYLWAGVSITILPMGHYVAKDLPSTELQVYCWLLSVFLLMVVLTIRYKKTHVRENNRRII